MTASDKRWLWIRRLSRSAAWTAERTFLPRSARPRVDEGLPLSLSINNTYGRSFAQAFGGSFTVLLDGDPQRFVVEYDVLRHRVRRYCRGENGHHTLGPDRRPKIEDCFGRVEVRWKKKPEGGR